MPSTKVKEQNSLCVVMQWHATLHHHETRISYGDTLSLKQYYCTACSSSNKLTNDYFFPFLYNLMRILLATTTSLSRILLIFLKVFTLLLLTIYHCYFSSFRSYFRVRINLFYYLTHLELRHYKKLI